MDLRFNLAGETTEKKLDSFCLMYELETGG